MITGKSTSKTYYRQKLVARIKTAMAAVTSTVDESILTTVIGENQRPSRIIKSGKIGVLMFWSGGHA